MRWFPFILLAIAGIVCQTTVVPYIRLPGFGPDVMFILAVYYALWGPWPDAALAGLALGFVVDLFTIGHPGRIGLHAFFFGAASWGIIQVRQTLVRTHPMAQVLITLGFAVVVELSVALYHRWAGPNHGASVGVGWALLSALYTAALSPILLWALSRLNKLTGLRTDSAPWTKWRN